MQEITPGPQARTLSLAAGVALALGGLLVGLLVGFLGRPLVAPQPPPQPQVVVVTVTPAPTAETSTGSGPPGVPPTLLDTLIAQTRHFAGDEKAPVTMLEFGDFQ